MSCSFCNHDLELVADFGEVALAGGFLMPEDFAAEQKYPLRLMFCPACFVVQLADHVSPDTLFKNYFYFSSASHTVREHARRYAFDVVEQFKPRTALEIGCNDGVLLKQLANLGVECTGVDPSANVTGAIDDKRLNIICDFFTKPVGKFDLVLANNVFAHVPDINSLTQNIADSLTDDGVFVMEVHDLRSMVQKLQYDWIYHEHLYYYSALALDRYFRRFGLEIFDAQRVRLHGGSIRYFIAKNRPRMARADVLCNHDAIMRLNDFETFANFAGRVKANSIALRAHIHWLRKRHHGVVAGYGASGRANALIQAANIELDYIVDDAPAKHGYYTPGSHIPIYPRDMLKADDTVLVFAWTYLDEIAPKVAGHNLIVPLPQLETISARMAA